MKMRFLIVRTLNALRNAVDPMAGINEWKMESIVTY